MILFVSISIDRILFSAFGFLPLEFVHGVIVPWQIRGWTACAGATSAIAASSVSSTISMCFFELAHNLNRLLFICRMKSLLRIINCLLLITVSTNICSSRTVLSESTGKPVIYASIGVINRNLGTVTDSLGNFSLKIPAEYINDSIRISSIGHVAKIFAVKDIKNIPDTIFLAMMRLCLMKS